MIRLSEHLHLHTGAINVGILRDGVNALLIDFGEGTVRDTLKALNIENVERVLFTHHHRDQASGLLGWERCPEPVEGSSARIGVPAAEREWFDNVEAFWNNPKRRWHLYDDHPHPSMLSESVTVHEGYVDGDAFEWGPARIVVLETPAHTDGSVTYLVEVDGERFAFTGDLLYDEGQLWDVHSLQKKGETHTDYHGFLGARHTLGGSLRKVLAMRPDVLVPSHGNVMPDPERAVNILLDRISVCYDKYVAVSALRYYFKDMFTEYEGRPGHMPMVPELDVPPFLRHFGTTWLILSETNEAFVMDCGSPRVLEQIRGLMDEGEISGVTGFWVTHYHDDHVDSIPQFQAAFDCVTRADSIVADVIEQPAAYRIPCISPSVARIDQRTTDGDCWTWNEFRMTAYFFPGQTYWHGGLLVEGRGVRLFFTGDSFTPMGMDDYCAPNRNLLGEGVGYLRCLQILAELQPTHCFNCHVNSAFAFTPEEIRFMRENLVEREKLFGELLAWEHPNYGLDPHWARCFPYEQEAAPGESVTLRVEFTNHSSESRTAVCRPVFPSAWKMKIAEAFASIPAKRDGAVVFRFTVPSDAPTVRTVIPVEVVYGERMLGQFRETILDIT